MEKVTIKEITSGAIVFSNGDKITYDHESDCCEWNFADFEQLDDIARTCTFTLPLQFKVCGYGFTFGDARHMFFVPCYSYQNGYYTNECDIYYNGKIVLSTWGEVNDEY